MYRLARAATIVSCRISDTAHTEDKAPIRQPGNTGIPIFLLLLQTLSHLMLWLSPLKAQFEVKYPRIEQLCILKSIIVAQTYKLQVYIFLRNRGSTVDFAPVCMESGSK